MVHRLRHHTSAWFCALFAVLLGAAPPAAADEGRPPIHVQIVLDSSGSMKKNDPRRLSSLAGMMFTDLAGSDDWVGILSMREGRFVEERISAIGDRRNKVRSSIRSMRFRGSTFCAEPLEQAAAGLTDLRKKQSSARQFVIFLSDGACRDGEGQGPAAVRSAARQLASADVKVFSIGLFGSEADGASPEGDLRTMASVTDGEFFSATKAGDLPRTFAAILGRIVGSEAQEVELAPGKDARAELDGYIYDASFIATGSGGAVVVDAAEGPDGTALDLPRRNRHSTSGDDFYVAAHGNGADRYYSVLRIEEPSAGTWTFRVDGPKNLEGLLIQNYALDPVVELGRTKDVYPLGDTCEASAWLRGKDGKRISDGQFLKKVDYTLYLTNPKGEQYKLELKPGKDGVFSTTKKLDVSGTWKVWGRATMKSGGLNKPTRVTTFEVRAPDFALTEGHAGLDLGEIKAGTSSDSYTVDFGASELPRSYEGSTSLEGLSLFGVTPTEFELGPKEKTVDVTFEVDAEHEGGEVEGRIAFDLGGTTVRLPVTATVVPLTFWERWGRIVMAIGIGIALLLLLLFVVNGIVSPHSFPAGAVLFWGESMEKLRKNDMVINEIRGTGKGFYRNAKLVIGGSGTFLPGGPVLAEIEATGPSQMTIRSPDVQLERVNKFDESKTKPVENDETSLHTGEVYKAGDLYLKVQ